MGVRLRTFRISMHALNWGRFGKLEHCVALNVFSVERRWVLMDHSKSKKHEGVAVYLAIASSG